MAAGKSISNYVINKESISEIRKRAYDGNVSMSLSMIISSLLLALNLQTNFDEITKAKISLICVVDELIKFSVICEINQFLTAKNLGKVFPIFNDEDDSAFSVVFETEEGLEKGLKLIKRILWENGILLSTKIVLTDPEIKLLKDYGEGE